MNTPRVFLCYAPRGAGLRSAVVYVPTARDARGWFTGPGEGGLESAYFVLEDYYTPRETRYVAVRDKALHTKWTTDEAMCHELAGLQDAFMHEWLFYRGDPGAAAQLGRYAQGELAAGAANVRFDKLNRLSKEQPNWTWYSPQFEHGVLETLSRHWPLDFRAVATA